MSLALLKKGLTAYKERVKNRKDDLTQRLNKEEKISPADEAWLDNEANHVDEDALIDTLENASDYERGLSRLDSKQKGLIRKLKDLGGGGDTEISRKRKRHRARD
ncbi:hypothetical protein DFH09DRAFT_1067756 [Mycena vulgaris]|nr:hypothetical protein DFH09DRAFT_1067756 [Mycena vulgaris]